MPMALFNFTFNIMATQSQLEFVNIEVLKDNRIFLNGRAIANSNTPSFAAMRKKLSKFSREAISILGNPNIQQKRADLNNLFHGFVENPYTRLGYCLENFTGKGVGNGKLKDLFIDTLINNKAFSNGAITHMSQFDIVVPNINIDRISDATSKVLAKELCEFTFNQCAKWNVNNKFIKGFAIEYFDDITMDWKKNIFPLPYNIINGIEVPIILIPKEFGTDAQYSNRTLNHLLSYVVVYKLKPSGFFDNKNVPKSGKKGNPTLKDYKGVLIQDEKAKEAISNLLASANGKMILLDFTNDKKEAIDGSLSDGEITRIITSGIKKNNSA